MRHRAKIGLESRLLDVRQDVLGRARAATELHTARVAAARAHALDPRAAAAALDAIAKTRSYRLGGHASFGVFVAKEIGISRATAHRMRALAEPEAAPRQKAETAALELARWLRAQGVRSATVSATAHRRVGRVQLVLDATDVARIVGAPRARKRARGV